MSTAEYCSVSVIEIFRPLESHLQTSWTQGDHWRHFDFFNSNAVVENTTALAILLQNYCYSIGILTSLITSLIITHRYDSHWFHLESSGLIFVILARKCHLNYNEISKTCKLLFSKKTGSFWDFMPYSGKECFIWYQKQLKYS